MTQSFFSVNIELNRKRTNRGYLTYFYSSRWHIKCSRVKRSLLQLFSYIFVCNKNRQWKIILQHYAPVLKFNINDLAWIAILFLYDTFCTVKYLDRCVFVFPPCKFIFEITLNRIAYFSLLHWAFDENDQKIELIPSLDRTI